MSEQVRAEVLISGRVQGVFFRASTRDVAERLGLKGYVRNLPGMKVEAVFEGPKDKVEQAIAWCHQGPPAARVSKVDVRWAEPKGEFSGFEIRY